MSESEDVADLYLEKFIAEPRLSLDLIERLRTTEDVGDAEFDKIFPPYYQLQSTTHWSSIQVARQISDWIIPLKKKKFIDIGCGVGKLCFLLRIFTSYKIYGIEQRLKLVDIAKEIIEINNFKNISVTQMNMLDLNWGDYDIYYLYNPFQEHQVSGALGTLEEDLDFDQKFFAQYTSEVFRQLTWAEPGKILITFHGYGGSVPSGWRMTASKHIENGDLTMWIKD